MKFYISKIFKVLSIQSIKELVFLPKILSTIVKKIYYYYKSTSIRGLLWLSIMYLVTKSNYFTEFSWWNDNFIRYPKLVPKEKSMLPGFFLEIISGLKKNNEKIRILEVGSGPFSNLAWGVEQNLYQVTAIDPLADIYHILMKKYHSSHPIKPRKGYGENLLKLFKRESFDVVFSRNALDHALSPKRCIDNMYLVLRKGGILYLEGFLREGTHLSWIGLHQHDLIPENSHLIRYDKMGRRTNLTEGLRLSNIYQAIDGKKPGDWYRIAFKKIE